MAQRKNDKEQGLESTKVPSQSAQTPWCPHCRSNSVRVLEVSADLRTIAIHCSDCGKPSVLAVPFVQR